MKIEYRPDPGLGKLTAALAAPIHARRLRDRALRPNETKEADLSRGYSFKIASAELARSLKINTADFHRFMSVCMDVKPGSSGCSILLEPGRPRNCPAEAREAFHISVTDDSCRIVAAGADGARRALVYLEDEMTLRRAPFLRRGEHFRWAGIVDRITRSPIAPYRWFTGWELEEPGDYYPEEYLNRLMHCGIDGIWVAGLLRNVVASRVLPELGPGRHRLAKLRRLTEKAARYGISTYFFCIEPRAVPGRHPVFAAHPEIRGARTCDVTYSLCTSTPLVREYIRESMRELFTEVPRLGGVINIFCGERGTTCWHDETRVKSCPRCRRRARADVIAEDLNCFADGIKAANSSGKLLAWTYSMDTVDSLTASPVDVVLETMRGTDPRVIWLGNFEHGGKKRVCDKFFGVEEYSLSYVGPSRNFIRISDRARSLGRTAYAKLQLGTTYEISSLPYLPVPGIVHDKFHGLYKLGVTGTLASWVPGGYPGLMLKTAGEAAVAPPLTGRTLLNRVAGLEWGAGAADKVVEAWRHFSRAFRLYPCANEVLYFGPITRCPSYRLHLEREHQIAAPYNFGLDHTRRPQPYEDAVSRWLGPFTAGELIRSFRAMAGEWTRGLVLLGECLADVPADESRRKQYAVAAAARIQFLSAANVIEFYTLRDRLRDGPSGRPRTLLKQMCAIVENDIVLAEEMKKHQAVEPFIGFHSEMLVWSYSRKLIEAKIRHDRKVLTRLRDWSRTGVDRRVLERVLPTRPPVRYQDTFTDESDRHRNWLKRGD